MSSVFSYLMIDLLLLLRYIGFLSLFIGYSIACLWVFDHLRITNSTEQVVLVLAPLPLVGYWLWRRGHLR